MCCRGEAEGVNQTTHFVGALVPLHIYAPCS